jgi:hypothetical protein
MKALRRDLVERKLWMLVALLVVAVAAVPVFLLKSASARTTPTVPAPPSATPVSGAGTGTTATTASDKPAEPTKVVLARIARNPFASAVPQLRSKPAPPSSGSSSTTTTSSSTTTAPTSTVSMVSPSPDTSTSQGSSSSTASTTSTTSSSTATPPSTSTPTSTIASTSPSTQAAKPVKVESWTTYAVSVRFGKDTHAPVKTDLARLSPLPSARQPEVMFMGVLSTGRSAVFALRQDVGHTGPGLCRPNHTLCSALILKEGQTEQITIPATTSDGKPQNVILRVVKITGSITHSKQVALNAFERISHAGMCDLLLADPMLYNLGTGTLSTMPKSMCADYPHSVPFSYFRTAGQ